MVRFITDNGTIAFDDPATTARLLEHEQVARLRAEAEQAALSRAYTLKTLAERLDIGLRSAQSLLASGRIRFVLCGQKNYRISELAVREFLGDVPAQA